MPANLTPDYHAAERAFQEARTDEERVTALEEMLRTIPKHKGTEKLQADIKRRLSRLKRAQAAAAHKKGGHSYHVEREGAAQVALVGGPNAGKSALVRALTHATPEVAPYPFTTQSPLPGMMDWERVQIQLVDLPAFSADHTEPWLPELVRAADAALLVVDMAGYPLWDLEFVVGRLAQSKVRLIRGDGEPDAVLPGVWAQRRTLLVANKIDAAAARENFEVLRELLAEWRSPAEDVLESERARTEHGADGNHGMDGSYVKKHNGEEDLSGAAPGASRAPVFPAVVHADAALPFPMIAVSAETGEGLDDLRAAILALARVIRVYARQPGHEPDLTRPFALRAGATLLDFAQAVHKDFLHLHHARLWGPSAKFDGQAVQKDHVLADGDIVELHL